MITSFACDTCFDTGTIDQGGREVPCPDCSMLVKLTGLAHGLGMYGDRYETVTAFTSTTMTFTGTRGAIIRDLVKVRDDAWLEARMRGLVGRNSVSSWAAAIEGRVRKALA